VDTARVHADPANTFALSCQLTDPCWEGTTARVIARAWASDGRPGEALEWIEDARVRCLRETDVFVAMHAAILTTDAEISLSAGQAERAEQAARALVSLAARTHMDAHLARGLELLGQSGS
jgi:hypothetical protein